MELRQLQYFVTTVRLGSVQAAAKALYVSPPAVSVQLKKFEEELGEELLVRQGRRLVTTQVGDELVGQAELILEQVEALKQQAQQLSKASTGMLYIGGTDAASVHLLPPVLQQFREAYPGVQQKVFVSPSGSLVDALMQRQVELAVITMPAPKAQVRAELKVVPLYSERMVVVAPKSKTFPESGAQTLRQLAEQSFGGLPRTLHHA